MAALGYCALSALLCFLRRAGGKREVCAMGGIFAAPRTKRRAVMALIPHLEKLRA